MKIEFPVKGNNDFLLISSETEDETQLLQRWNNCVLSAQYNYGTKKDPSTPSLLIVREI